MADQDLAKRAAELGFQPAETGPAVDANRTLAEVIQSRDPRYWEAFPVMLANAAQAGEFKYEAANACLEEDERKYLKLLVIVSLGLYASLGQNFDWTERLFGTLPARLTGNFRDKFNAGAELELGQLRLASEKFKENFRRFFRKSAAPVKSAAKTGEKLDLELAVSRIFTLRQKELFLKKLRRKKMTKTEKEYFSRVVKKKAQALANEELHLLARQISGL